MHLKQIRSLCYYINCYALEHTEQELNVRGWRKRETSLKSKG